MREGGDRAARSIQYATPRTCDALPAPEVAQEMALQEVKRGKGMRCSCSDAIAPSLRALSFDPTSPHSFPSLLPCPLVLPLRRDINTTHHSLPIPKIIIILARSKSPILALRRLGDRVGRRVLRFLVGIRLGLRLRL